MRPPPFVTSRPENSDPFMARSIHPLPSEDASLHNVFLAGAESRRSLVRILGGFDGSDNKSPVRAVLQMISVHKMFPICSSFYSWLKHCQLRSCDTIFLCVINGIIMYHYNKPDPVYCLQLLDIYI